MNLERVCNPCWLFFLVVELQGISALISNFVACSFVTSFASATRQGRHHSYRNADAAISRDCKFRRAEESNVPYLR